VSRLADLRLLKNRIGPEGATSLAEVIAQCRALTRLDLDDNNIKSTGAQNLASVLAQCPLLAHLILSDKKLKQTGQGALQKRGPQLESDPRSWCRESCRSARAVHSPDFTASRCQFHTRCLEKEASRLAKLPRLVAWSSRSTIFVGTSLIPITHIQFSFSNLTCILLHFEHMYLTYVLIVCLRISVIAYIL
jgi:hypothetical protein